MTEDNQEFFEKVGTERRLRGSNKSLGDEMATPVSAEGSAPKTPVNTDGGTSWASSGDVFWQVGKNYQRLPAGIYRCDMSPNIGPMFIKVKNQTDGLIRFPDSESFRLLEEMKAFQGMRQQFAKHGFLHKRGILLYGPPGGGKTSTIQLLLDLVVNEHGGVAVLIDRPQFATACLQVFRSVEPDRQVIGILEDLDALVENYGESQYLALLDGESQVDRVIYVATTNYPERLDVRFVDRPSRFDTIRYIGMPSPAARKVYFEAKVPEMAGAVVQKFVSASEGYSVAHMRELIILTQCFGQTLEQAKTRLDKMKVKPNSSHSPDRAAFGFNSTSTGRG